MQAELLPCPFCGSPEVRLADAFSHYVVCTACNAFGPTEFVEPWGAEWNRRYFGATLTSADDPPLEVK